MLRWERPVLTQCTAGLRRAIAYALASLDLDSLTPHDLLRLWRQHWPIENRVYSVRDLTLGVDAGRVRTANAPRALAAIRNTILST